MELSSTYNVSVMPVVTMWQIFPKMAATISRIPYALLTVTDTFPIKGEVGSRLLEPGEAVTHS